MDVTQTFHVATSAIALYNSCETLLLVFTKFSKYSGLYFWSLVLASGSLIPFVLSYLDLFYGWYAANSTIYRPLIIVTIGWYCMVTGFSMVMYSRLGLVGIDPKQIRYVRYFIIFNIIFSHFLTTVFTFGSNVIGTEPWTVGYSIIEKIQVTLFCLQETILGAMYIHSFSRKTMFDSLSTPFVMRQIAANVFVLILDISVLVTEYVNLYNYQVMLKASVYSIKIKFEFYILSQLATRLKLESGRNNSLTGGNDRVGGPSAVVPSGPVVVVAPKPTSNALRSVP
ncbi:Integral membrane protein [Plasmodiophora brassicae]|uniref:DUF7703 domain-containing protein n=1 Tax=Plasmodiophora brassicae TaxID=37360 RepID=A0A0G4IQ70_PLABS|nr:hypothetical protein PBRA_000639 [Plasmodiophora brassicae]SPQ97601.1 unnamed protein product [Plasmodiophora brassicae]